MTDQTASRQLLKTYFAENCIPTESNFYDLIDGMLNQADDGIFKPSGNPLCIVANGDATTTQKALNFYTGSPSDAGVNPAWMLQLNPRSNQNSPSTAKPGFSISDGTGNSCLFIDPAHNYIGIGTITPSTTLDINGGVNVTGSATFDNTVTLGSAANASNALTVYPPATFNNTLTVTGAATFYGLTENTGATFNNTVTLGSAANASNALTVYPPATFNSTVTIGSTTNASNALTVNAQASFYNTLTIGASGASNALTVNAPTTFNNTLNIGTSGSNNALTVNAPAWFNNSLTIYASDPSNYLSVNVPTTFNNTLTIGTSESNNALTVNVPSTFNNTLTVKGNISNSMWGIRPTTMTSPTTPLSGSDAQVTATFTSYGGTLLIFVSGSGYITGSTNTGTANSNDSTPVSTTVDTNNTFQTIGLTLQLDSTDMPKLQVSTNIVGLHCSFVPICACVENICRGNHTIKMIAFSKSTTTINYSTPYTHPSTTTTTTTTIDENDFFVVTVLEFPF